MIFNLLVCSVALTSIVFAQMLPKMPSETVRNQGTISYPELVAMMAMRNQLPAANQEYSLLNLTGGRPIYTVPTSQDVRATVKPQQPPASDALRKQLPTAMSAAVQVAVNNAVRDAVQVALPSAVKSAVQQIAPMAQLPPPRPAISPAVLQSIVQSAVKAMLPSAVGSATKIATPKQTSQPAQRYPPTAMSPSPSSSSSSSSSNQGIPQADLMLAMNNAMREAVHSVKQTPGTQSSARAGQNQMPQNPAYAQACGGSCPPKWLGTVHSFTGVLRPGNPMCSFNFLASPCNKPNTRCNTGYSCCPMSCLETIKGCYDGPPTDNLCLPDDVTQWWPEMMQLFLKTSGMGRVWGAEMPATPGIGMGGMMGGPMGGPMGGQRGGYMTQGLTQMLGGL